MSFAWGRFSRKQLDVIANATARLNILDGSVRSGKTIASLVAWIMFVGEAPPGELLMVGKTERTLKRNVLDLLESMVGSKHFKYKQGAGEAYLFGRRIYLAGANDERAEGKIRGMTLAGAYGDEITLWPESFFTMLLSRLSLPGARFIGTTNPDSPFHWLNTRYLEKAGLLNLKRWQFRLEDNLNLDPAYVEALKKEYTGLWYKRFILGLWVLAEGAIYDMWDDARFVRPAPEDLQRFIVAVDYGTSNPCTFGLYAWKDGPRPVVHLVREYWYDSKETGRQKTDAEYADDFREWLGDINPEAIYVDPSAASFIAELRKRGYTVSDANNDVIDGIRFVASMLNQERFFVDPSCINTIKEFASYVWDPRAQLKGEDKPLKQNDHAMDRNRYALHSHFNYEPIQLW
jgi:PBSX family phage terminase large subunit